MSDGNINILLVGKTGVGKSSTANMILGETIFDKKTGTSVTKECSGKLKTIFGRQILVIDAPGFCDTDKLDTAEEIDKYLLHCVDGIHVVALVLSAANRPTQEEIDVIKALENKFGRDMLKFLVIIVTRADDLEEDNMTVEDFVKVYEGEAEDILRECCRLGNVIGFDNKAKEKRDQQVKELLSKVDILVEHNHGGFYTRAMLATKNEENERLEEERQRKIQEEEEARKRKEEEYEKARKDLEEAKANEERNREAFEKTIKKMEDVQQREQQEEEKRQGEEEECRSKNRAEINELQSKLLDGKDEVERLKRQNDEKKQQYEKEQEQLRDEINRLREEQEQSQRGNEMDRERNEGEIQVQQAQMQGLNEYEVNETQAVRDEFAPEHTPQLNNAHMPMGEGGVHRDLEDDKESREHPYNVEGMEASHNSQMQGMGENVADACPQDICTEGEMIGGQVVMRSISAPSESEQVEKTEGAV